MNPITSLLNLVALPLGFKSKVIKLARWWLGLYPIHIHGSFACLDSNCSKHFESPLPFQFSAKSFQFSDLELYCSMHHNRIIVNCYDLSPLPYLLPQHLVWFISCVEFDVPLCVVV